MACARSHGASTGREISGGLVAGRRRDTAVAVGGAISLVMPATTFIVLSHDDDRAAAVPAGVDGPCATTGADAAPADAHRPGNAGNSTRAAGGMAGSWG